MLSHEGAVARMRREDGTEGLLVERGTSRGDIANTSHPYAFQTYGEGWEVTPGRDDMDTVCLDHLVNCCEFRDVSDKLYWSEDDHGVYGVISLASAPVELDEVLSVEVGEAVWGVLYLGSDGAERWDYIDDCEETWYVYNYMDCTPVLEAAKGAGWETVEYPA